MADMARKTLELTGQRFGKWTVLGRADLDKTMARA